MQSTGPYIPTLEEITQLRQICVPLTTSDAKHTEHQDFSALNLILAAATVIGLGEQTHGTSEFFQMKHRLLNFLVTKMGFRLIAIKANMGTCQAINEYIHQGTGKLKSLMKKFYCGSSQEVFDVIEWMRKYNQTATVTQKIHFAGFDFQEPALTRLAIEKCFSSIGDNSAINLIENIFTNYNTIKKIVESQILSEDQLTDIQHSSQYQQLLINIDLLEKHIKQFESKLDQDQFRWIKQHVKLLRQSAVYLLDFDMRHHAMMENIQWLQSQYPNAKTILWAHNFHLQKHDEQLGLGQLLAQSLGEKYCTIGFATYAGTYSAYSKNKKQPHDVKIPKPTPDSLEANLHRLEMPIVLVSFKDHTKIPLFLQQPIPVHVLTTIAETHSFRPQKVTLAYDAIIFIAHTSAAKQMRPKPANMIQFASNETTKKSR
ncbi:MAG: erythromycin esterase family protein [Pseudomonadota bacterium]